MNASKRLPSNSSLAAEPSSAEDGTNISDEERAFAPLHAVPLSVRSSNGISPTTAEVANDTELRTRPNSIRSSTSNYIKRKTSRLLEVVASSSTGDIPLAPRLAALVEAYASSPLAAEIKSDMERVAELDGNGELRDVTEESQLRARKRASWSTQFRILSGRAFKNLYRDPALLAAHYLSSIALACRSFLFWWIRAFS